MKKTDILLKISDTVDWLSDEDGAKISVTVWNKDGSMFDCHLTEHFNELHELELDEVSEGDMLYYGNLSVEQMTSELKSKGFNVEIFKGTEY